MKYFSILLFIPITGYARYNEDIVAESSQDQAAFLGFIILLFIGYNYIKTVDKQDRGKAIMIVAGIAGAMFVFPAFAAILAALAGIVFAIGYFIKHL